MIFFEKSLNILTKTILENSGFQLDAGENTVAFSINRQGSPVWELWGGSLKGELQKPPNNQQHIINFVFPRQVDGSD